MPQLDATSFPPQLIWLALSFFLLLLLMAYVALPRVGIAIERRRERIEGDLETAAKLKADIDRTIHAYERALAEARAEATATVNQTKEHLAQVAADRQRDLILALNQQTTAAETRIAEAKRTALADIRGVAGEAAKAAGARLIGLELDDARIADAVDQVLKGRA